MKITRSLIRLDASHEALADVMMVDVRLDGHRVWSKKLPEPKNGEIVLRWPRAVRERLKGRTEVSLADAVSGTVLASAEHRFGLSNKRLQFTDARGRWLAMTKWNRLGPVLDGRSSDVTENLLVHARELVDVLSAHGHDTYMVGGTLLGIVREGGMLPHDDDVDLAYLSPHADPSDIGLESYRMERTLKDAGYTVVRHSLTHLEIEFFNELRQPDHYIDIFTGFERDGLYNQPFALRGPEIGRDDLLPTHPRDVNGVALPEPASPEGWLAYAYGEGWRVPDPTFKFVSPRSTINRFETWFGVFNRGRVYWDKRYLEFEDAVGFTPAEASIERFLAQVPAGARILDLGCGDGKWSRLLAARGHRVTGVDYSHEALRIAHGDDDGGGVDFRYINANDRAELLQLGAWMLGTGDEWCVFAHHSLQSMTKVNRQNVMLFLDLVLRGRGFADIISDTSFSNAYRRGQPSTWHLPTEWIARELVGHPLSIDEVHTGRRRDGRQRRKTATVRVRRVAGHITAGSNAAKRDQTAQEREDAL